jgi:hypothetical protein
MKTIGPVLFLGASPQTPWVGFAEVWVKKIRGRKSLLETHFKASVKDLVEQGFCEAKQMLLLLFLKRRLILLRVG